MNNGQRTLNDFHVDTPRFALATHPAHPRVHTTDVLVIGGGAAGLAAALQAAEYANVILLTRAALPESNSAWAQGGIAAALDAADSPVAHIADTLVAGAGLSDPDAVEALAWEAPDLMRQMAQIGVPFERYDEAFALGLEGGHSHRRILHVGDATGWALVRTLIERARACPRIHILEGYQVVDLLTDDAGCAGALALNAMSGWHVFNARATILATGGAGALYGLTSNQLAALGEGIALAYRAGAAVSDMEFVQFHPTVFRTRSGAGFLISEATRGEGGRLLTPDGHRFMPDVDLRAELAPRDIVARGIFAAMQTSRSDHVLLDLTHLSSDELTRHFPTIYARCRAEGVDPAVEPIPVAPAAHYLMGGVSTDQHGATSLPGLYAAGECACTGVHGANRLASNSLLECLVFGRRAGAAALTHGVNRDWRLEIGDYQPNLQSPISNLQPTWRASLTAIMRNHAGLQRTGAGLAEALRFLGTFPTSVKELDGDAITAANAALTARLIVTGALLRQESRGAHFRTDFPHPDDTWRVHIVQTRDCPPHTVERIAEEPIRVAA
jgi:L-aspartate oxidase